jgi:hypothetical protein
MSFEYVDVLSLEEVDHTIKQMIPEIMCTIYVERQVFDADLLIGLETIDDAIKQLKVDAPRSIFKYNGKRHNTIPKSMPHNIIPYCTQCVMGLPVTILCDTLGMVCESGRPMFVYADESENVFILKSLIIKKDVGETLYNVNVVITCKKDQMVEIKYMFEVPHVSSTLC